MDNSLSENKHLAECLRQAKEVARDNVIKSSDLDRSTREKLSNANYLSEVIRGWYLLTTPSGAGTTTLWYCNFWNFLTHYLTDRFGKDGYCLSAESSADMYAAQNYIPKQVVVLTKKKTNTTVQLLHKTSILLYTDPKFPTETTEQNGLNVLPLTKSLVSLQPAYFKNKNVNAQIVLKLVPIVDLSRELLNQKSSIIASRLVGAFKAMGLKENAERLKNDIATLGIKIKDENPFEGKNIIFDKSMKASDPSALRIEGLIKKMRSQVLKIFPPQSQPLKEKSALRIIEKIYKEDAYHSLSIEGYQVTEALIEQVANNSFNPNDNEQDREQRNALAAKGYYDCFKAVSKSIEKSINGENTGKVFYNDLQTWYRQLFAPMVQAGILNPMDLAGYRNSPVYIKGSLHVPPRQTSVMHCMEVLEEFLSDEKEASVRAILGHFFLGYIHPYSDGNGRICRFLMNLNLISGGFTWTVIRVTRRNEYLAALEEASSNYNIEPFAKFVLEEMKHWESIQLK